MASLQFIFFVCAVWMLLVSALCSSGEELPFEYSVESDRHLNRDYLDSLQTPYDIVYPTQSRRGVELEDLSTKDHHRIRHKHAHFHHTSFSFDMQGRQYKLKLDLNSKLFGRKLKKLRHIASDTQMMSEDPVNHCYYHGKVRKVEDSFVALSTCSGLRGVIRVQNQTYHIQPLQMQEIDNENITIKHPHVVFLSQPSVGIPCATDLGQWKPYETLHKGEYLRRLKIFKSMKPEDRFIPKTRPIRLALVIDYSVAEKLNYSHVNMFDYAMEISNLIDMYMKKLSLSVMLVYAEVWNMREQFGVSPLVKNTLERLLLYTDRIPPHVKQDVVQFVTMKEFSDMKAGAAIPESICTSRAVGVSQISSLDNVLHVAAKVSHMIAHNLGIGHIEPGKCGCSEEEGCIMQKLVLKWNGLELPKFSMCVQEEVAKTLLHAGLGSCLLNDKKLLYVDHKKVSYPQTCGNNKLERGEECDCGSQEECYLKDPCCNPKTCLLKPWANCRYGSCCYNCTVMPESYVCRHSSSQCDVPEYCNGISGECPDDELILDGQPCANGQSYCYKGQCNTYDEQCQNIWGKGAIKADQKCFEHFNSAGSFSGHCGWDPATAAFIKCQNENLQCGLLQCADGFETPNVTTHSAVTNVVYDDAQYQCKIIHEKASGPPLAIGMVADGTKCDAGKICLGGLCVNVSNIVVQTCPLGPNGITCSGNGVCTTALRCFCNTPYTEFDCSTKMNITSTAKPAPTDMPVLIDAMGNTLSSRKPKILSPANTTESIFVGGSGNRDSTLWMVIVLASVVGGCVLLLSFCFLCYRRRSPATFVYEYRKKKKVPTATLR